MNKITAIGSLLMMFTVALTSSRALPADPKKVAVLEFHNYAGLTDYEMERVSDVVRKAALLALPSDLYLIMTRENIFELLPPGRKLSECEGECEVETGRLIGADYIVIGSVGYFGGRLEVSMKLYSTASGALLDQGAREADDVSILKARVQDVARQVFKKLPIQSASVKEEGSKRKGMASAASSPKGDFGWLTVVSDPPGLKVVVNGRSMGRTPLESRELATGTYEVLVTDPRYYDEKVSVDVECAQHRTVKLMSSPREDAIQTPGQKKMSRGREIVGIFGIEMVEVPAGKFLMGSSGSGEARGQGEWPVHEVVITRPFLSARYEVTQGIREEVMGENPSAFSACGPDCPVESVSWFQAVKFCNALSEREGLRPAYRIKGDQVQWDRNADGYRLPTEAE